MCSVKNCFIIKKVSTQYCVQWDCNLHFSKKYSDFVKHYVKRRNQLCNIRGKTVIITGCASGMGLLCGQNFYKEGANVVLVDINKQALEEINKEMPNALCLTADITEFEQVKYTVDTAMEKFKSVDFMINMAGGSSCRMRQSFGEFCDRDIKDIKWGMDINLMAPIYYCHEVMRIMRAQKSGVIINIGSIKGVEGDPAGSDYTISKSAVMTGLTESMAILGAPYGVRCCCV